MTKGVEMRVAVLEDDVYVRAQIVSIIKRLRPHWVIREVDSLGLLQNLFEREVIDVLFADIHVADGCFFESQLKLPDDCALIVITGDVAFALKAIEDQVVDYLIKPVGIERVLDAIERFERRFIPVKEMIGALDKKPRIKYIHGTGVRVCAIDDVAYVRANLKTCEIFLMDGERGLVQFGINHFETLISSAQFWRIHRSYLLNIDSHFQAKRDELGRMNVEIPSLGVTLPVSKTNERRFRTSVLA